MAIALTLLTLSPLTSYFTLPAADGHGFLSADKQYSGSYINLNTTNFTNYMTVPLKIGHDTTMVKPFVTTIVRTLGAADELLICFLKFGVPSGRLPSRAVGLPLMLLGALLVLSRLRAGKFGFRLTTVTVL